MNPMLDFILRLIWFAVGWGLGFLALLAVYLVWEAYRGSRP
jgi:hypothetical protein